MSMEKQYYIELEKYSLAKLKIGLQKRDMIPSRVILKEKIEHRFKILTANGIKNLNTLTDVLKTKQKIEIFSKRTGLPIDYLTILNREVKSYLPNPMRLATFPGINIKDIQALESIGIRNTKQLFNKCQDRKEIKQLSIETGIPIENLDEFFALSDLARLYGVGPVFARIIYDVGIKSVNDFVKYEAHEFITIYENKTGKKADFGVNDISFSLEIAKELLNLG